jgi:2-(3-amino-3-carboxypropyl)histidine synthase
LTPYETAVAVGKTAGWMEEGQDGQPEKHAIYPMNFYEAGTPWAIARTKATYN